jgi:hypothetical protein
MAVPSTHPSMPADDKKSEGFSLKRWSQRKLDAARAVEAPVDAGPRAVPVAPGVPPAPGVPAPPALSPALPPVDSLTIDSDFTAFLKPKVDESLKRQALKKLFTDPHFNVMDGLDVYIDDYSKSIPIPPEILEQLVQRRLISNPPAWPGEATPEVGDAAQTDPATRPEAPESPPEITAAVNVPEAAPTSSTEPAPRVESGEPKIADDGAPPETLVPR